jgi:2'-5' RNA ligase
MRLSVGLTPSVESLMRIGLAYPLPLPAGSRRVPPAHFHVTVLFLRDYPEAQLPTLISDLEEVFRELPAFWLIPRRIEWVRQTLWLKFEPQSAMSALVQKLHAVARLRELSTFQPHVTLARLSKNARAPEAIYPLPWTPEPLLFPEVALFHSVLRPEGPTYEKLARYSLNCQITPPL